jgi:hypothetical protein
VIAGNPKRWDLVRDTILPSVADQGFDEVLLMGFGYAGKGYRYVPVAAVTRSTLDALMLRDVAAAATGSDVLVYLCDDHRLHHRFGFALGEYLKQDHWDVLVPRRYTVRDQQTIPLNMGVEEGYCGGHACVVHRRVVRAYPWMSTKHSPVWDLTWSQDVQAQGFRMVAAHSGGLDVEDVEYLMNPESKPWT